MCQIVGGPAAHVAQRMGSLSQLAYASLGDEGSAAKIVADSFQACSTPVHLP